MSIWTHVNGCIRIDGIESLGLGKKEDVLSAFGKIVHYDSPRSEWKACSVPVGREGSIQYQLIRAGDGMVLWTIPIWGDLRDYHNVEEIREWFEKIVYKSNLSIRSAILEVEVEGQVPIILQGKKIE